MALLNCSACKKSISEFAVECPHCGMDQRGEITFRENIREIHRIYDGVMSGQVEVSLNRLKEAKENIRKRVSALPDPKRKEFSEKYTELSTALTLRCEEAVLKETRRLLKKGKPGKAQVFLASGVTENLITEEVSAPLEKEVQRAKAHRKFKSALLCGILVLVLALAGAGGAYFWNESISQQAGFSLEQGNQDAFMQIANRTVRVNSWYFFSGSTESLQKDYQQQIRALEICSDCGGLAHCNSCRGSGTCRSCSGTPTTRKNCPATVSRRCTNCTRGERMVRDRRTGHIVAMGCKYCGGIEDYLGRSALTGRSPGKRGTGWIKETCRRCGGKGFYLSTCNTCRAHPGKCKPCRGDGKCHACSGSGRAALPEGIKTEPGINLYFL